MKKIIALLGQAVEIPQLNDHPLPFRQAGNRLPQSDFLHHPFFRFRVRENVFQREAFVPRFSLNRLRGGGGRFGQGDFFRGKPGLAGNFLNRRLPAQRPGQAAAGGLDGRGLLISILKSFCAQNDMALTTEAEQDIDYYLEWLISNKPDNFANGREMRNLFETMYSNQANRLADELIISDDALTSLTVADLPQFVLERSRE